MPIISEGDHLVCVKHVNDNLRIYLIDKNNRKKKVSNDDSFFVDVAFTEATAKTICELIAKTAGLHIIAGGKGLGGSFIFKLI